MDENEETFSTASSPIRNSSKKDNFQSVVPWKNPEEFIEVYKKLYSADISEMRWAVEQISVWQSRCHPSLPAAVEATVGIVDAVIQDFLFEKRESFCLDRDMQALYSMAIIRFVNLVLVTDQRDTLSNLAKQNGIPQWIVDLRHDAAHANTPPLALLRMGANIAMSYLNKNYWRKLVRNCRQVIKDQSSVKEYIANIISKFKEIQFSRMGAGYVCSLEQEKDMSELTKKLKKLLTNQNKIFVDTLVEPGVFLSSNEIERTLRENDALQFLTSTRDFELPSSLLKFWIPLIRMLHTANILSYFMESLLLSLEYNSSRICQKTAIAWVICLLKAADPLDLEEDSPLSARFRQHGVQLEHARLLFASVKGLNPYSTEAYRMIANYIEDFSMLSVLNPIICVQQRFNKDTKNTAQSEPQEGQLVFTGGDLQCDAEKEIQEKRGTEWRFSYALENIEWDGLPLGCVINPIIPTQTEEDDEDMDTSVEEKFIIEEDDKEPTVKVKSTTENIFPDPDIGDMISWY